MAEEMSMADYMKLEREIVSQTLPELSEVVKCKNCGQPHHLVRVNDRVAFYVHHGAELEKCHALGYRTSYLGDYGQAMYERVKSVIDGNKPKQG